MRAQRFEAAPTLSCTLRSRAARSASPVAAQRSAPRASSCSWRSRSACSSAGGRGLGAAGASGTVSVPIGASSGRGVHVQCRRSSGRGQRSAPIRPVDVGQAERPGFRRVQRRGERGSDTHADQVHEVGAVCHERPFGRRGTNWYVRNLSHPPPCCPDRAHVVPFGGGGGGGRAGGRSRAGTTSAPGIEVVAAGGRSVGRTADQPADGQSAGEGTCCRAVSRSSRSGFCRRRLEGCSTAHPRCLGGVRSRDEPCREPANYASGG